MFVNLSAEMARYKINQSRLAKALKVSEKTISNKINGRNEFTLSEINTIINLFPKKMSFSYLFKTEDEINAS